MMRSPPSAAAFLALGPPSSLDATCSPAALKLRVFTWVVWWRCSAALTAGEMASMARTPLGGRNTMAPRGRSSARSHTATLRFGLPGGGQAGRDGSVVERAG